ncbi:Os05g0158000 [Oryza sativa Japonica Group]|uniref:Os05g0158000 protein n=1 Tax=Oryza sativa subsp. japonica TaxID=39947 RepID=A0A0P0WI68_ORYSJ|nr:Os05g0158000 [Oryza sativa Japonica Group]
MPSSTPPPPPPRFSSLTPVEETQIWAMVPQPLRFPWGESVRRYYPCGCPALLTSRLGRDEVKRRKREGGNGGIFLPFESSLGWE